MGLVSPSTAQCAVVCSAPCAAVWLRPHQLPSYAQAGACTCQAHRDDVCLPYCVLLSTGFTPYVGEEGFSMLIPARWNPSKEQEFANQVFR